LLLSLLGIFYVDFGFDISIYVPIILFLCSIALVIYQSKKGLVTALTINAIIIGICVLFAVLLPLILWARFDQFCSRGC
jgi:hypothetical protein